nr:peptidase M26 [Segatella buccae]
MVGTYSNRYAGTFDGQGHTLTINWNTGSMSYIAPFGSVENATIKNLHVKGEIKSKEHSLAGLIADVYGTTTNISGCIIEVNLKGKSSLAGIAFSVSADVKLTITDCIVKGDFTATSEKGVISGFVCRQYGNCTLANCLYAGTNNGSNEYSYTFARNADITNCYYLTACGSEYKQGTKVTAEQLRNGEVAYQLQKGRNEQVWGQTIGTNNEPRLIAFDNSAKKVYQVKFTYNNEVKATRYANSGKTVSLPTFTPKDLLGSGYNEHHYYTLAFAEGFNENTTVTGDKQVAINITEKDACEIASKADWKEFCDLVNGGQTKLNAKMTANVDLGSDITMAGTGDHKYAGMFDGQNHTLKFNWDAGSRDDIAPFQYVKDATIKNLRTQGKITSKGDCLSGMVYAAFGTTTLTGCISDVDITGGNGGWYASNAAGMVKAVVSGASVQITDCLVKGSITDNADESERYMAGFVLSNNGTYTLTRCLYVGKNNAPNDSYTFGTESGISATFTDCYYLNTCGKAQGDKITEAQLRNGYVAYKLQKGRESQVWGQTLGTDNEPQLTADATKRVYEVKFVYNGEVKATRYATNGQSIHGGLPTFTAKDLLGTGYNPHHYYAIAFEGGFNENTTVSSDQTVAVTFNKKDYYEIASKTDWKAFCDIVGSGQNTVDAKMTKDVDLGEDIAKVGTSDNPYGGTFDGQNHVLTVNWDAGSTNDVAPFGRVNGATIKNLRTEGTIRSGGYYQGGLIDESYGENTVTGCVSNVNLTSTISDWCGTGGLISYIGTDGRVTISDCLVTGDINATTDEGKEGMGGFVYANNGNCTMNNCLYAGTNNGNSNASRNGTFTTNTSTSATLTLNNCHYLNPCGKLQGEPVTKAQLKNGYVAYKLQKGRESQVWGQTLGTDNEPQLTADATKRVYEVKFVYNGEVKATRYANSGQTVSLPTVQELLGADYAPNITYALSFEGDFSASSTVTGNTTVVANVVFKDISIATKEDWRAFNDLVLSGEGKLNAKLTADIDLGGDILKIGDVNGGTYSGTFDGQGHTVTVDWNGYGGGYFALFPLVTDATIKNLRVSGQMTTDAPMGVFSYLAGGTTIYEHCVSDVRITSGNTNSSYSAAGMVRAAYSEGKITFKDCIVAGDLNGTTGNSKQNMGGFVCSQADDATCTFDNCLYTGTNNSKGGYTFAPNPTLNNCYYLNPFANTQGERIVEKQLKSGEVAYKLQGDRTDSCHWAQVLGEWPGLYREADKAKPNYVYYNKENNGWTCDDFRLTDGQSLSIGLDFTATKATYDRTLAAGKATLCLPYELPVQGFRAYTLADRQESRTAVHFKEVNGTLGAYRPYLLVADAPARLDGENLQVKADRSSIVLSAGNYYFKGAVHDVVNWWLTSDHAYILQADGQFHKVTSNNPSVTVPAYRAYISYNSHEGAKRFSIVFDGETTGIYGTTDGATDGAADGAADGAVYNLQGQRVADRLDDARHRLPTGVYIVGGRKVVVK